MFQNITGEHPLSCLNKFVHFVQKQGLAFSSDEKCSIWCDVAVHRISHDVARKNSTANIGGPCR